MLYSDGDYSQPVKLVTNILKLLLFCFCNLMVVLC